MGSAGEGPQQIAHGRTRDRILATALGLFNEEGLAKVSTNGIAAALGISPGNLYYHFRSKGQIAEWLVRRFESRIAAFGTSAESVAALDDLWLVLHLAFETIHEYRFIFRDISFLVRESPALEHRVRQMTARGLVAAQRMCDRLAQASIIRAQREDLDSLALQIVFTAACWATFEKLLPQGRLRAGDAGRAAYQVLTLLRPYLEPRSRAYLTYLRSKYALE
jgi:AcrR family transcriptional regulator